MTNDTDRGVETEISPTRRLIYRVDESPPVYVSLLCGLQQSMLSLSKSLTVVILVAELVCSEQDEHLKTKLFSSTMVMSGLCTLLQCSIGIRLPLYQGPSASYVVPLLALASLKEWQCPSMESITETGNLTTSNMTDIPMAYREQVIIPKIQLVQDLNMFSTACHYASYLTSFSSSCVLWAVLPLNKRLSGSLLLAGAIHTVIGMTGMVGAVLRFVGPITVVPAITLIGLFMVNSVNKFISTHWGVGVMTSLIAIILSLYLAKWNTLIPWWSKKKGFHIKRYPLHRIFSILIAMVIGWLVSFIMTEADYFTDDPTKHEFKARADARIGVVHEIEWFSFPYPGQFGTPSLAVGVFISFLIATFLSVIDSIGDYYACAKVCQEPPPPAHAVNRGLMIEGIASTLSGAMGIGHSTSTIAGNIGAIAVTKVASRRVFQVVGIIYIIFGIVGKIGAFFISIPYCVLGGIQVVNFGILIGVVLSNLTHIDLNSTRNLSIIGISLLVGMMIPNWMKANADVINTGVEQLDSVIKSILTNAAIIGGGLACIMDNTIPGTLKERGLIGWQVDLIEDDEEEIVKPGACDVESSSDGSDTDKSKKTDLMGGVYDLPFIPKSWKESACFRKLPILPGYRQTRSLCCFKKCRKEKE